MAINRHNAPSMGLTFAPGSTDAVLVKLFGVTVRHGYYSQSDGFCPDLSVAPTPTSAELMSKFGMALRQERFGFSIFIQKQRIKELQAYLLETALRGPSGTLEFWERLTFSMQLQNPDFINITQLPLTVKIDQSNLYASNHQAHLDGPLALLSPGPYVDGDAFYDVIGRSITLRLPPRTKRVLVTDIAGRVVLPQPGADEIAIYAAGSGDEETRWDWAQIDLTDLPFDQYTICILDAQDNSINAGKYPWTVLYNAPKANTLLLLDMLFTQPTPASQGVYPLPPMFGAPAAAAVSTAYVLPFDARHTFWQYYIVSQGSRGALRDLHINGRGTAFTRQPAPVLLPNGALAIVFMADTALPLSQHPTQVFQLTGQRSDARGHENTIRISRLPVAAATPVWPSLTQQYPSGISEIYVYV
ncbi:hypothetical protein [Janthinobacterium sp. MDB2-8]|uniref:hypothetical protein n=1 Tax=Janthinobacterium sp. MDB2-8 TaxID=1259338 RepID=UPI003F284B22